MHDVCPLMPIADVRRLGSSHFPRNQFDRCGRRPLDTFWIIFCTLCGLLLPSKYECQGVAGHLCRGSGAQLIMERVPKITPVTSAITERPAAAGPHGIERASPLPLTRPLLPKEQDT